MKKVITKRKLSDSSIKADLAYWESKTPEERVAHVDFLRKQYYGDNGKLVRVARVINRKKCQVRAPDATNKAKS